MGKKSGNKRPIAELEDDIVEEEDEELKAELAALEAMRSEQAEAAVSSNHETKSYNKAALIQCVENLEGTDRPFLETLQIGHFDINVADENDDLEREVVLV